MASGNALTPEELLSDLDRLRRQARSTRRSWALAIITLVYTGAALLASLYDVENVLYRLGWNPGSTGAPLAALPNVLLPALVLLAAGAGAFLLRPRPGRA
jgi:hypothetical protein